MRPRKRTEADRSRQVAQAPRITRRVPRRMTRGCRRRAPPGQARRARSCGIMAAAAGRTVAPPGRHDGNQESGPQRAQGVGRRARLQQFRRPHRPRGRARGARGDRCRHHAVRHRRHLRRPGRLGDACWARCSATRRKDIVLATKFGMPMDDAGTLKGALAPLHHARGRGEPDAAEDRLDRPLPAAPARSADADRGDAARARRPRARRARSATSAARTSRPGRWSTPLDGAQRGLVGASSPARTSTACWCAGIEGELMPAMRSAYGLGLLPYFPLASGLLTGKYRRGAAMPPGSRLAKTQRLADRYITERNWRDRSRSSKTSPSRAAARCSNSRSAGCSRARGGERHRRRHQAGADRGERPRGGVEAVGGGTGRDRRDHGSANERAAPLGRLMPKVNAKVCGAPRIGGDDRPPTLRGVHMSVMRRTLSSVGRPARSALAATAAFLLLAATTSLAQSTGNAVEYYHVAFNHYFLTAFPNEIDLLDRGVVSGWQRTGHTFNVWKEDGGGLAACRFFSTAFGPRSSHFYTPDAGVRAPQAGPALDYEAIAPSSCDGRARQLPAGTDRCTGCTTTCAATPRTTATRRAAPPSTSCSRRDGGRKAPVR